MDFTLSEDQLMFVEAARTVLADTSDTLRLRKMLERKDAFDQDRWNAVVETGLTVVLLPEAAGGLELGALDFALIAEAAGYYLLPEPLVESAGIAAPMLAAILPSSDYLADPSKRIAIGHPSNPVVADADIADAILLNHNGATHLVKPSQVTLTRVESIDQAFDRAALFCAAQGLGLAQRAVDLAVEYAKERQQFGKPIGTYQAVKHHLASAQTRIEFARPVLHAAAAGFANNDIYSRARISQAKLACLEAADYAARASLQVHGAMGYSYEVDVHLILKRALGLTYSWGEPALHRARVSDRIFNRPVGPDQTFASEVA